MKQSTEAGDTEIKNATKTTADSRNLEDAQAKNLQRQFLPAALAIQEAPASPVGHAILWLLVALFLLGIVWSALGEVDVVVSAPGRVIPNGQVKIVQAPEAATVSHIHIIEGDRVVRGQPLISLDATYANADDTQIANQLAHNRVQHYWRTELESWFASDMQHVSSTPFSHSMINTDLQTATGMLRRHQEIVIANIQAFDKDLAASYAQGRALKEEYNRATATLAVLRERAAAYETLMKRQYGARVQYLEVLQQQTEMEMTLPVLISRQTQLAESANALLARKEVAQIESRNNNLAELALLKAEYDALRQDSRKAGLREQQLIITSPATGQVQELAIHTIGGMVTTAQPLLKVVPEDATIEIEATLMNKDIGFVHEGQRAEVKVEAFNFTKYGLLEAHIVDISDDAINDENLGWVFKMRLILEQDTLPVEGKNIRLSPGMSVTSEMTTGRRRLIEFFLSPLLRYQHESLRER